jgi:hypothetical protein
MGMIVNSKMLQIKVDNIAMKRTIFLSNEEKRLMSNQNMQINFFMQNDFFIFLCNAIFLSNEEKRLMSNHGNEEKRFFYAIFLFFYAMRFFYQMKKND